MSLKVRGEKMKDINKEFLKLSDKDQRAIINLIRFKNILKDNELQKRIDKAIFTTQRIIDFGFDYDGFESVERLKGLIDMMVEYARETQQILLGDDDGNDMQ